LTINIFFIILIVVLIKDGYRRKFFIASTICAYVLAAILPYLLTWSSLNVTILFYVLVIGLISFFAYDQYKSVIGSTYADAVSSDKAGSIGEAGIPAIEKSVMQSEPSTDEIEAKAEADLEDKGELPSHNGAEQTPAEIIHIDEHKMELKTVHKEEPEEAADEAESVLPDDVPAAAAAPPPDTEIDIHTVEEPGEPEIALPDDIPAAVTAPLPDAEIDIHTVEEPGEPEIALPDDIPAAVTAPPPDAEIDIHMVEEPGEPEIALPDDIPAAVTAPPPDAEADIQPTEEAYEPEVALPEDIPAAVAAPPRDAEIDIHTVEEPGEPEVALPDDIPAAVAASPADTEAEPMSDDFKDRMDEELDTLAAYDIETLIELAFAARARGDYYRTLTILEKILEQDPPEEMVNLILDDVEVLFAKLVS